MTGIDVHEMRAQAIEAGRRMQERTDAATREYQRRVGEAQEQWPAALEQLDGVTDPGLRAVLDLHRRERDRVGPGRREGYDCHGCDSCCQSAGWPCSTVETVAGHLGIVLPEFPLYRAEDGSTDAPEVGS